MASNISLSNNYTRSVVLSIVLFMIGSILLWIYLFYTSIIISIISAVFFFIAEFFLLVVIFKLNMHFSFFKKILLLWSMWLLFYTFLNFSNIRDVSVFLLFAFPVFVLPLFSFLQPDLNLYRILFRISFILTVVYILGYVVFFNIFLNHSNSNSFTTFAYLFAAPSSIILLTAKYHTNKAVILSLIANILTVIMAMILARRSTVVYFGSVLFFFIINIFLFKVKVTIGLFRRVFIIIISLLIPLFLYIYINDNNDLFDLFFKRIETGFESREDVISDMVLDFNKTPFDWIIGRGMLGNYRSMSEFDSIDNFRQWMENGYLYFILKGGCIYLLLILSLTISAIYKGFFKSNNLLSKAFGCTALIYLIDMIGFGIVQPNLKFVMLFLAIGGAHSLWIRNLSDGEIVKCLRV
jgi:hypothetical protein